MTSEHVPAADPLLDIAATIPSASRRAPLLPAPSGRLGALASWWRSTAGSTTPQHPVLVVIAADDGAADGSRTAASAVGALTSGEALTARLADRAGVPLRLLDVSVDGDPSSMARGGGGNDRAGALTALAQEHARSAIQGGVAVADELIDSGADLLLLADAGAGAAVAAAAIIGLLAPADAVAVVDRGPGIDDSTWMQQCSAIRDAMRRGRPVKADPAELLAVVGGADIAAMSGLLLRAAQRRTPVLFDGPVSAAAALVGQRASHRARDWWLAAQRSDGATAAALERLDLVPVLDLGMRSPEGVCALLALPILIGATLAA